MRTKMSPRRAFLTALTMTVCPVLFFIFCVDTVPHLAIFVVSVLINWPIIRWLDDREWYREWKNH